MGHFRIQKRIKVLPGVHVNLNKGMPSVSVGGHRLTANISKRGLMTTASIPGSGLSYRHLWNGKKPSQGELEKRMRVIHAEMAKLSKMPTTEQTLLRAIELSDEGIEIAHLVKPRSADAEFYRQRGLANMQEGSRLMREELAQLRAGAASQPPPVPERYFPPSPEEYVPETHDPSLSWPQTFAVLAAGFVILFFILIFAALVKTNQQIESVPRIEQSYSTPMQVTPRWGDPTPTPDATATPAPTPTPDATPTVPHKKAVHRHHHDRS
jgi:hypothetical protein